MGTAVLTLAVYVVVLAPVGARALFHSYEWLPYVLGLQTREQYATHFTTPDGNWRYTTFRQLAQYISVHSSPSDTVLMWGWDPLVDVLAARKAPTRFGFSYPLVSAGPLQSTYRQLFMQEISRAPPRYIIVSTTDQLALTDESGLQLLEGFPEFQQFLHSRYRLAGDVATFQIWAARVLRQ